MQNGGGIGHNLVEDAIWKICAQFLYCEMMFRKIQFSRKLFAVPKIEAHTKHITTHHRENHLTKCIFCLWQFWAILFLQFD